MVRFYSWAHGLISLLLQQSLGLNKIYGNFFFHSIKSVCSVQVRIKIRMKDRLGIGLEIGLGIGLGIGIGTRIWMGLTVYINIFYYIISRDHNNL
jgi:hypothetical protein